MSGYVKNHIMYDYFCILKHHIRYCSVVNAKYHIQYDFIRVIQLSYRLPVFRRADPISGCSGSLRTPPAHSGPETQDVAVFVSLLALDVVFTPYPVTRSVGAEKTALLIP